MASSASSIQSNSDNSVPISGQQNINKTDKSVSEIAKETFSFLRSFFMSALRSVSWLLISGASEIVQIILFPVSLISAKPSQMVHRATLTATVFLGLTKKENAENNVERYKQSIERCHTFNERAEVVAEEIGDSLSDLTVSFLMSPIHALVKIKKFFEKIKGE